MANTPETQKRKKSGRPRGSKNYDSSSARRALAGLCNKHFTEKEALRLLKKIEQHEGAGKAFDSWLKLLEFAVPKLSRVEHTGNNGEQLTIEHVLKSVEESERTRAIQNDTDQSVIDVEYETIMNSGIE